MKRQLVQQEMTPLANIDESSHNLYSTTKHTEHLPDSHSNRVESPHEKVISMGYQYTFTKDTSEQYDPINFLCTTKFNCMVSPAKKWRVSPFKEMSRAVIK
jgi:hypothetical protein